MEFLLAAALEDLDQEGASRLQPFEREIPGEFGERVLSALRVAVDGVPRDESVLVVTKAPEVSAPTKFEAYYDFAEELADAYLVMERGEVIARGPGSEMQAKAIRQLVAI